MWAVSALPVHSVDRGARRKAGKNKSTDVQIPPKQDASTPPLPHNPSPYDPQQRQPPPPQQVHQDSDTHHELFEPAIDGPPSPGDIRALSKQVKSAAAFEKHQGHQTTSSGSSSLRSLASADRPSWEHALEGFSLSRKSSGRSTSSSMPSRERPESVQIFGKTIFNRRGKLRRESAGGSSGSSMYSAEFPSDAALPLGSAISKDPSAMPAIFRRRPSAQEDTAQRKFQISEPYNFQHLTHTQKDDLPQVQRSSRMALASEFSQMRASKVPLGVRGAQAEESHFAGFSSETLPLREEDGNVGTAAPHAQIPARNPARIRRDSFAPKNQAPIRRIVKHPRPQDAGRVPPPRPPRSPLLEPSFPSPPVPPRVSSRVSMRYDGVDPLSSMTLDRPQTSNGFRYPQPFAVLPDAHSPPATSHGYAAMSTQPDLVPESRYSRVVSPPDDANWPLPCPANFTPETSLPQVPEEDENAVLARQSRASIASNSSFRGSQSVPMLRKLSLRQDTESRRRSSGASDTLGQFDMYEAQNALKVAMEENIGSEAVFRESWEDDIDYCYDHAVEADCDYAWERPSCDLDRDDDEEQPVPMDHHAISPAMLTPAHFDVPALSPASQHSAVMGQEAITPTVQALPKSSNFSLPRTDSATAKPFLQLSTIPDESDVGLQEFHLSPTLLIPGDFPQRMAASEDRSEARDFTYNAFDEPTLNMDTSMLLVQSRTSDSTMASNASSRSVFERHTSTTSAGTDYTRLTMSTSSLDIENYIPKRDADAESATFDSEFVHARTETMPPLPEEASRTWSSGRWKRAREDHTSARNLSRRVDSALEQRA
jgi:hypothetical protein